MNRPLFHGLSVVPGSILAAGIAVLGKDLDSPRTGYPAYRSRATALYAFYGCPLRFGFKEWIGHGATRHQFESWIDVGSVVHGPFMESPWQEVLL